MTGQLDGDGLPRARSLLRIIATVLIVVAALLIAAIAAGVFDPKPLGQLIQRDYPGINSLNGTSEATFGQPSPWPVGTMPDRFSIRLSASHIEGELDSGYGLVLKNGNSRLVVAVSPLGYVAVREEKGNGAPVYLMPWQPWPHVRTGTEKNEVWLDVAKTEGGGTVKAWINRELLWQGNINPMPNETGLWISSFGGRTVVDFRVLDWFAAPTD